MIQQRNVRSLVSLTATEGFLHKKGTDTYVGQVTVKSDEVDQYEEVSEKPPYTEEEYKAKVTELIRQRYSNDEEHAIRRKALNAIRSDRPLSESAQQHLAEYDAYNLYVEECKINAPSRILADRAVTS